MIFSFERREYSGNVIDEFVGELKDIVKRFYKKLDSFLVYFFVAFGSIFGEKELVDERMVETE